MATVGVKGLNVLHVPVFCCFRKVDYFNAKGFVQSPYSVLATLASGVQVRLLVYFFLCQFYFVTI